MTGLGVGVEVGVGGAVGGLITVTVRALAKILLCWKGESMQCERYRYRQYSSNVIVI